MPSQSFIFHGSSKKTNMEIAYAVAIKFLGEHVKTYILANSYPDFMLVSKNFDENTITIENTRNISEFLSQKSEFGGYKVVVIDSAENMNGNSANSILKTIEEPPFQAIIILTTTNFFALLPTIRSRCHKVFVNGSIDRTYSVNDCFFNQCIQFFDGNMKDITSFAKNVSLEQKESFFDIILNYAYCKFMNSLSKNDAKNYIKLNEIILKSKSAYLDQQSLISSCCLLLRNS